MAVKSDTHGDPITPNVAPHLVDLYNTNALSSWNAFKSVLLWGVPRGWEKPLWKHKIHICVLACLAKFIPKFGALYEARGVSVWFVFKISLTDSECEIGVNAFYKVQNLDILKK